MEHTSSKINGLFKPKVMFNELFTLAECPTWDGENNRLYWTDISNCELHSFDFTTGFRKVWKFESELGCFGLTDKNRMILYIKFLSTS